MNSTEGKNYRILNELQYHMRVHASTDRRDLCLNYIPTLRTLLMEPLKHGKVHAYCTNTATSNSIVACKCLCCMYSYFHRLGACWWRHRVVGCVQSEPWRLGLLQRHFHGIYACTWLCQNVRAFMYFYNFISVFKVFVYDINRTTEYILSIVWRHGRSNEGYRLKGMSRGCIISLLYTRRPTDLVCTV